MIDSLAVNGAAYSVRSYWGGLTIAALPATLKQPYGKTLTRGIFRREAFCLANLTAPRSTALYTWESFHKKPRGRRV